jgi:hypothetical protein
MSETYVIPDIHEDIGWANSVLRRKQPEDRAVFLGDYFHQFNQDRTGEVCVWLKEMMAREDVTLLVGNHDQSHIGASLQILEYLCSGYDGRKHLVFEAHFPDVQAVARRLRLFTWVGPEENPTLLTHAGLSAGLLTRWSDIGRAKVTKALRGVERRILSTKPHRWLRAGYDRGGAQPVGGITWCDWRNFEAVPGIRQMCGHTVLSQPSCKDGSWCIDTNQQHYAVIDELGEMRLETIW